MDFSACLALLPPSPYAETLARRTLDALQAGDALNAVDITQYFSTSFPSMEESLLLHAVALSQAGDSAAEAALQAWDAVLRRNPLQTEYLMQALQVAWRCHSTTYAERWMSLLRNVFSLAPPFSLLLELEARGQELVGSVGISDGKLLGWTWQALDIKDALPQFFVEAGSSAAPALRVEPIRRLKNDDRVLNIFAVDLPKVRGSYTVRVTDAQGRHAHGSPVVVSCPELNFQKPKGSSAPIAVIIPVYADRRATLACIGSVLASRKANRTAFEIVAVWDHGPDASLLAALQKLAARGLCTLHVPPYNMGFLGAVNYALERHSAQAVVLLNADTLVCAHWLDRLHRIGSRSGVGTVTPFGTHAELVSFPAPKKKVSVTRLRQVRLLDAACSTVNANVAPMEIPVGVGFCMYISRTALKTIGGLDGHSLFRGYGEEVAFCLCASKHNLRNLVACNVFVGHVGESSFGASKAALARQNNITILAKYPKYEAEYDSFIDTDPLLKFRQRAAEQAITLLDGPLHVANALLDASPDLVQLEEQGGHFALLLVQPCGDRIRVIMRVRQDMPFPDLFFELPQEISSLSSVLQRLKPSAIFAHGSSPLVSLLLSRLGLSAEPFVVQKAHIPTLVLGTTAGKWITPCPRTLHGWQGLCRVARQAQVHGHIFKVLQLESCWMDAPRPTNVWPAPPLESFAHVAEALLLFDAADCVPAWQRWADDNKLAVYFLPEMSVQTRESLCA